MKNSKISIDIDKPCSENFNSFVKTHQGGFCNNCSKEVIDFTKFTEEEISNYFKHNKFSKTCGKFSNYQLEKEYSIKENITEKVLFLQPFKLNVAGFYILSLLSLKSFSQEESSKQKVEIIEDFTIDKVSSSEFYKGTIVSSSDNLPLPGALITVRGTSVGTSTDFDGDFSISKEEVSPNSELVITYQGFNSVVIKASDLANNILLKEIGIELLECVMVGEVATHNVYTSTPSFFQKMVAWFK